MYENEEWKPVVGYEGLYEVSNLGRVRSLDRMSWNGKSYWLQKGKILNPGFDMYGYKYVNLYKNCNGKKYYIHRLVASAFIPNTDNLPVINHINEIKTDNRAENLEHCTQKHNMEHSGCIKKMLNASHKQKCYLKASEATKKPVIQLTLDGNFVSEFDSASEASRKTGIYDTSISRCCKGKQQSAGNYLWKYKNGTEN